MSNHKSLVFFNKEGDYLNAKYNRATDRFEGDILFHQSSSDVYKTYGIYAMEYLPEFEFAMPKDLTISKFQLFNEWGMHFYEGKQGSFGMDRIEPVNNDPSFYSKWIYGPDFETLFPIGTFITFESKFLEFTNTKKTYAIVGSKKGAVMILTDVDNATFESMYFKEYDSESFGKIYLRGSNLIGIYNYIDADYRNNLSEWNEPSFYERYYNGKKLNVVNSESNDGTYTVKDSEITDAIHFEYQTKSIPSEKKLIIEAISRTDVPKIYDGGISISNGKIKFTNYQFFPRILKPGREFKIVGSQLNSNFLTVGQIMSFEGISNTTTFTEGSQVIYKNRIYQCKTPYVQDFSDPYFGAITPENTSFWGQPNYITVEQQTLDENMAACQVYLTTDRLYFEQEYMQTGSMTLAMAAEKYREDLKSLNIDLYAEKGILKADLMYSSEYAEVNFYHTDTVAPCLAGLGDRESFILAKAIEILRYPNDTISTSILTSADYRQMSELYDQAVADCNSYKIGTKRQTNERLVEVKEQLRQEMNYEYSENFKYNIVFTDIDEFGIKLTINKHAYEEEVAWLYSGAAPDMERTIDRTLRNWLTRNYKRLYDLGILAELDYIGSYISPFYNAICIRTEYPNIPIEINRIEVGTTADYHIEHSKVLFNEIGANINIKINSKSYEMQTIYGKYLDSSGTEVSSGDPNAKTKLPDIPATLEAWAKEHAPILETYGIIVKNINNLLKFDIKRTDRRLEYEVKTGKVLLPGQTDFIRTDRIKGKKGVIVTGNEAKLTAAESESSFEDAGFGTGRVISINNTEHPLQDVKYNLLMVDPKILSLSYQGPFWGLEKTPCKSSAFITMAFSLGFAKTACLPLDQPGTGGPFNPIQHNKNMFGVAYNPNEYLTSDLSLAGKPGVSNLVDLIYIQLANEVFVLGDNLIAVDALSGIYISTIYLTGNSNSIEVEFNTYNSYLYCLSKTKLFAVDPVMKTVVSEISLTSEAADMAINPENGDIYVTYADSPTITIFDCKNSLVNNLSTPPTTDTRTGKMVFNDFEKDMYITTDAGKLIRINGSTRSIQTSYDIPGLMQTGIFYEPVFEAIYAYSSQNLWKIDNGEAHPITGITGSGISDVIFNNLTGTMNISDAEFRFKSLTLDTEEVSINTNISARGKMALNKYDGGVYLASAANKISVIDSGNGMVIREELTSSPNSKIIYNPEKKSMWVLQPSISNIFEIESTVTSILEIQEAESQLIDEGRYGTLDPNYVKPADIWIKAYECVRKPRENFEGDAAVKYYWKWAQPTEEFFIYDLSGEMLEKTGQYAYTGPKPLKDVPLNKMPNRDVEKTDMPEYQQTVFDMVEYELSYIDDQDDVSTEPTPLQLFVGFKAKEEGAYSATLQMFKKEEVEYSITSTPTNDTTVYLETIYVNGAKKGRIKINAMSEEYFTGKGFKIDQYIAIYLKDVTNTKNKYISNNNGYYVRIEEIYSNYMIVRFFNDNLDFFETESTVVRGYPKEEDTTYLKITISVIDREIGRFSLKGQTEIEDIRFKTELNNNGKLIGPNEIFIFKEYDIYEGGVDWTYLNMKRKELLMMKNLIYPYIGSYKSIINAINFFGYNDLQLNEYYRNIDVKSENFSKLFKVEIPDIFDNTVEGWTDNDFIKHTFPNENFEETNLLNLTYFITDKEGNNKLNYSIDEVTIKLQGLKQWLKRNIIPLTHKILDITGRAYFSTGNQITHRVHDIRIIDIKEDMTPISCKLNEVYLMPVNSGSTVYNCVLDFYAIMDGIGADKNPTGLVPPPRPYNYARKEMKLPEYFTIKIRTWKTYREWAPFATYMKGDKVIYYGKIYESNIDNNKIKSPRKQEDAEEWSPTNIYEVGEIVKYNRMLYVYSGLGSSAYPKAPVLDNGDDANWLNITEWIEIDYEPVQTINEYRRILPSVLFGGTQSGTQSVMTMAENGPHKPLQIAPFNFTIDSNIDPFITIEVTSENGYGSVYRDRKNYEIRGLKDLTEPMRPLDAIGPFIPIKPIEG